MRTAPITATATNTGSPENNDFGISDRLQMGSAPTPAGDIVPRPHFVAKKSVRELAFFFSVKRNA